MSKHFCLPSWSLGWKIGGRPPHPRLLPIRCCLDLNGGSAIGPLGHWQMSRHVLGLLLLVYGKVILCICVM
jgi:hypothetical protein